MVSNTMLNNRFYNFIQRNSPLKVKELNRVADLRGREVWSIVEKFQTKFAKTIGPGECVSFASARMSFYCLLKAIDVGQGDEVMIIGFSCAVMADAVLKTGATPVFTDVSLNTMGSDCKAISNKITKKTKAIVAQHSFGIPCEIETIVEFTRNRNIFLFEDCALSLGSKRIGKTLGSYGDASIFSTDHSKPLNTFLGGLLYSENTELLKKVKQHQRKCAQLSLPKKRAIFSQLIFEEKYNNARAKKCTLFIDRVRSAKRRVFRQPSPFLDDDFGGKKNNDYEYPSLMPTFIAQLGLFELDKWSVVENTRRAILAAFVEQVRIYGITDWLPSAYVDKRNYIVPNRLVLIAPFSVNEVVNLKKRIDLDGFWFTSPLQGLQGDLETCNYTVGSCPMAESIARKVINLPCLGSVEASNVMLRELLPLLVRFYEKKYL